MLKPANYDDMVSDIQAGKVVQSNGYSASSQDELDTVIAYPAYQEALKADDEPEAEGDTGEAEDEFSALSYAELKEAAAALGLELGANPRKANILAALREVKAEVDEAVSEAEGMEAEAEFRATDEAEGN